MGEKFRWFAIKAEIRDPEAVRFVLTAQKTMYGGKTAAVGDAVFVFASENEGGSGLIARGVITDCERVPRTVAVRQTPRISVSIECCRNIRNPFGRENLRPSRGRSCDTPEAELDFKLYRQATNKMVGLTDKAGEFLDGLR